MGVYLRVKFGVSSIILTSFRQECNFTSPPPPQNEPLKGPPRLGSNYHCSGKGLIPNEMINLFNLLNTEPTDDEFFLKKDFYSALKSHNSR